MMTVEDIEDPNKIRDRMIPLNRHWDGYNLYSSHHIPFEGFDEIKDSRIPDGIVQFDWNKHVIKSKE